jgi:hypothetical protein
LNEEAKQTLLDQLVAEDPEGERLKGIAEDKNVNSYYQPTADPAETGWMVKTFGELQQFTTEDATVSYSTVAIKNTLWPGSITVCNVHAQTQTHRKTPGSASTSGTARSLSNHHSYPSRQTTCKKNLKTMKSTQNPIPKP